MNDHAKKVQSHIPYSCSFALLHVLQFRKNPSNFPLHLSYADGVANHVWTIDEIVSLLDSSKWRDRIL